MLCSLSQLEEKLDPARFFRANRRHLVNLDFIDHVQANDAGGFTLTLAGGVQVEVSRRRAAQFRELATL